MRHVPTDVFELKRDLPDAGATRALGAAIARAVPPGSVILLEGPLGAGKTTFVQGAVDALGAVHAASPSFVVAHEYPGGPFPIWHLDLYRVESLSEIEDLDLAQYMPADGIAFVEWANRDPRQWPRERVEVALAIAGAGRSAVVRGYGRCAALVAALA